MELYHCSSRAWTSRQASRRPGTIPNDDSRLRLKWSNLSSRAGICNMISRSSSNWLLGLFCHGIDSHSGSLAKVGLRFSMAVATALGLYTRAKKWCAGKSVQAPGPLSPTLSPCWLHEDACHEDKVEPLSVEALCSYRNRSTRSAPGLVKLDVPCSGVPSLSWTRHCDRSEKGASLK